MVPISARTFLPGRWWCRRSRCSQPRTISASAKRTADLGATAPRFGQPGVRRYKQSRKSLHRSFSRPAGAVLWCDGRRMVELPPGSAASRCGGASLPVLLARLPAAGGAAASRCWPGWCRWKLDRPGGADRSAVRRAAGREVPASRWRDGGASPTTRRARTRRPATRWARTRCHAKNSRDQGSGGQATMSPRRSADQQILGVIDEAVLEDCPRGSTWSPARPNQARRWWSLGSACCSTAAGQIRLGSPRRAEIRPSWKVTCGWIRAGLSRVSQ